MTKKRKGRTIQKVQVVLDETAFLTAGEPLNPTLDYLPAVPEDTARLQEAGLAGAVAGKAWRERIEEALLAHDNPYGGSPPVEPRYLPEFDGDDVLALVDASFRAARVRLALETLALFRGHDKAWVQRQYERWRAGFTRLES